MLSLVVFSEDECLKKVNELRKILGGAELKELDADKIKEGLTPHLFEAKKEFLTKEQIENYIKDTKEIIDKSSELSGKEADLKTLLEAIQKESKLKQYSLYKKLYEAGISLITDKNVCPLCGREWTDGSLKEFLENKKKETDVAKEKQEEISGAEEGDLEKRIRLTKPFFQGEMKNGNNHLQRIFHRFRSMWRANFENIV